MRRREPLSAGAEKCGFSIAVTPRSKPVKATWGHDRGLERQAHQTSPPWPRHFGACAPLSARAPKPEIWLRRGNGRRLGCFANFGARACEAANRSSLIPQLVENA